jgi:protein gp37
MFDLKAMIGEENLQRGKWWSRSWNPSIGCSYESTGCTNCYARELHTMRHKALLAGKRIPDCYAEPFSTVRCLPERLEMPLHWRKPQVVFVDSMSDLFHEDVPDAFISDILHVILETPRHFYIICTKRTERMQQLMTDLTRRVFGIFPNLLLMVTAENQETAEERIPLLLDTPAKWRGVSVEPLLESLDLTPYLRTLPKLSWIIAGCESGPNRRQTEYDWYSILTDQCGNAGIPIFLKQIDINGKIVHAPYASCLQLPDILEGAD